MIFLEIVIIGLLVLLLVRFIGKLISKIKADEAIKVAPVEDIFSHETVENVDEPVEVKEVYEDGNEEHQD